MIAIASTRKSAAEAWLPCSAPNYPKEEIGLIQRGIHLASALGARVWHVFGPEFAYAIDQGGGGSFDDFGSPFNVVDVPPLPPPPPPPPGPPSALLRMGELWT